MTVGIRELDLSRAGLPSVVTCGLVFEVQVKEGKRRHRGKGEEACKALRLEGEFTNRAFA